MVIRLYGIQIVLMNKLKDEVYLNGCENRKGLLLKTALNNTELTFFNLQIRD